MAAGVGAGGAWPTSPDGEREFPSVPGTLEGIEPGHVARYRWAAQWCRGKRVLDVGCGCGYGALALGGGTQYLGLDRDAGCIRYALAHYRGHGEFGQVRLPKELPPFGGYGAILCFEFIEHLGQEQQPVLLAGLAERLGPGGVLLLSCPVRGEGWTKPRSPFHAHEPEYEELMVWLGERFGTVGEFHQFTHGPGGWGDYEGKDNAIHEGRVPYWGEPGWPIAVLRCVR